MRETVTEPFKVPFKITNDGYFDIHDVSASCAIRHVEFGHHATVSGIRFEDERWTADVIEQGQPKAIILDLVGGIQPTADDQKAGMADIIVIVDFKSDWIPFYTFHHYFRFIGTANDGKWDWLPTDIPNALRRELSDGVPAGSSLSPPAVPMREI